MYTQINDYFIYKIKKNIYKTTDESDSDYVIQTDRGLKRQNTLRENWSFLKTFHAQGEFRNKYIRSALERALCKPKPELVRIGHSTTDRRTVLIIYYIHLFFYLFFI